MRANLSPTKRRLRRGLLGLAAGGLLAWVLCLGPEPDTDPDAVALPVATQPVQPQAKQVSSLVSPAASGRWTGADPSDTGWRCDRVQPLAPTQAPADLVRKTMGQTFSRLAESDLPLAQAAGELLRASPAAQPVASLVDQMKADCEQDPSTSQVHCRIGRGTPTDTMRRWDASQAHHQERLSALARQSTDPHIDAWAWLSRTGEDGGSHGLSAQGWAERDADNAAPWLALADEALRNGDWGSMDTALWRAAQAQRLDLGDRALLGQLMQAMPSEVQGWQRLASLQSALGAVIQLRFRLPLGALHRACRREELSDANRRQRCEALLAMLLRLQDTDVAASAAATLQQRLAPEVSLRLDREALLRHAGMWAAAWGSLPPPRNAEAALAACRASETLWRYHQHAAAEGDLAAMVWLQAQPVHP